MSKYPRTFHLPFSKGATNDDRISFNIDKLIGEEIVITEKIDGSNTAITKNGVYGRSHIDFTRNPWDVDMKRLHSIIQKDIEDNVYIFGESVYAIHSLEYTNLKSYFYLFGVRDNDVWLSWDEVEEYAYLLDLELVPVLFKGIVNSKKELEDLVNKLVKEPSELGGVKEGVVVRVSKSFKDDVFTDNLQKWVRPNHVTTDSHWTKNWKRAKLVNNGF